MMQLVTQTSQWPLVKAGCLLLVLLLLGGKSFAKDIFPMEELVAEKREAGAPIKEVHPLSPDLSGKYKGLEQYVQGASYFNLNQEVVSTILTEEPVILKMNIPFQGENLELELVKVKLLSDEFRAVDSRGKEIEYDAGVYYRGIQVGAQGSVVFFTFSDDGLMGIIGNDSGNLNLGRLDKSETDYILYRDKELDYHPAFECGNDGVDLPENPEAKGQKDQPSMRDGSNCVKMYLELDHDMYLDAGATTSSALNYMTGLFNNVIGLYQNESIQMEIREIKVWDTPDTYATSDAAAALNSFRDQVPTYNGDLASLVSRGDPVSGGMAWYDGLCQTFGNYGYSYTYIFMSYNAIPTYSWSVQGLTHEIGHNLNASHTHDCAWNGNDTAIDGCGDEAGYPGYGDCPTAGIPDQGSIISYCYLLDGFPFSFVYGFGEQPGDRIRWAVYNAPCLSACSGPCTDEGMSCDDGNPCTDGDIIDSACNCVGMMQDSDEDGVCDAEDACPGHDDTVDIDADGLADGCDECIDVDADGFCAADDADDNDACNPSTEASNCYLNTNCTQSLLFTDFESGWGGWLDGGSNAALVSAMAYSGNRSLRIRGTMGISSTASTADLDLSNYEAISVSFTFVSNAMSNGEGFQLQGSLDDGATWGPIKQFEHGVDFQNGEREFVVMELQENFTAATRLRFINMGSNNTDHIYIDDVHILVCGELPPACEAGTSCDDNNEMTINDAYLENCECVGELIAGCNDPEACNYDPLVSINNDSCLYLDCAGDCGGEMGTGASCDDGDASTINDAYNGNCECTGEQIAGCNDPEACNYDPLVSINNDSCLYLDCAGNCGGEMAAGADCDDGNASTINDTYNANCECIGEQFEIPGCTNMESCNYNPDATEDDGSCMVDDCLGICGGDAVPGTSCYDGNSMTINDRWDENCNCIGELPMGNSIGEVGEWTVMQESGDQWHTVFMTRAYVNPVVVAYSLTSHGSHATTVRVKDVSASSFKFQMDEWDYLDGAHISETIGYMVVEAGKHTLADGKKIQAGLDIAGASFRGIRFHEPFDEKPAVIVQAASVNSEAAVAPRMRYVSTVGFQAKLQRQQLDEDMGNGHEDESIGWIAMSAGTGFNDGSPYEVKLTGNIVSHSPTLITYEQQFDVQPVLLTSLSTYKGSDPAYVRYKNKTIDQVMLAVTEEQSKDNELTHVTEEVSMFLFEPGPIRGELGMTMPLTAVGEAGEISISQSSASMWLTVYLENNYVQPAVVAYSLTENGADPSTVRVRNIGTSSFEIQVDEWDYRDGGHIPETVGYLVVESGRHQLADGRVIQAGYTEVNGEFQSLNFPAAFERTPVVLTQVASDLQSQAVATRMHSAGKGGIKCRLQREDAAENSGNYHEAWELVTWIAMEEGFGRSANKAYEVGKTADAVKDAFYTVNYRQHFEQEPTLVYGMQSYDGSDACFPRYSEKGLQSFQIRIAEEQSHDDEIEHTDEVVGYMLFEQGIIRACNEVNMAGKTAGDSPAPIEESAAEESHEETTIQEEPILEVYPNPTTGMFYFEYENPTSEAEEIVIALFSTDGKLIAEQIHTFDQKFLSSEFDMGSLPGGMYILRLVDQDKVLNKKMILKK